MAKITTVKVGIMGFGRTGRQIYDLAASSDDIDVVAIADIGKPEVLHYLLCSEVTTPTRYTLEGNFLCCDRFRSRLLSCDRPEEVPWDIFDVDIVIDSTGKYRAGRDMECHLSSGAPRVLLRGNPLDHIDRIVVPGINSGDISADDRMLSAGSPTTTALALLLHVLSGSLNIESVSMTTVHAYTSDQALQDYAGSDFRRSRSAAENIIPNRHDASLWLGKVLPDFEGKALTSALNVPIHQGCLLDVNLVMADDGVTVETINDLMRAAVPAFPGIIAVAEDPIVSSDVIGTTESLLFDAKGTIKAGGTIIKTLAWYENLGHAARLLEVARLYAQLDSRQEAA